jgi:hypothetical protein
MAKIKIQLPADRNFTGLIQLEDDRGNVLAGPFAVCGRANDHTAAERGNSSRVTTLPYGDTPLGWYRVTEILDTGRETLYRTDDYGPHGVVVMEPTRGEAALAESNGRFTFFIQGGAASTNGRLRATNGALRLRNQDQRELLAALREMSVIACHCVEGGQSKTAELVTVDSGYEAGDPPPMKQTVRFADWITPTRAYAIAANVVAHGEYDPEPEIEIANTTPEDTSDQFSISSGNEPADVNVPFQPPSDQPPSDSSREIPTKTIMAPLWPIPVPVRVPVDTEEGPDSPHAQENEGAAEGLGSGGNEEAPEPP